MSYTVDKKQPKNIGTHQLRYVFRFYRRQFNHRKLVTCRVRDVERLYGEWLLSLGGEAYAARSAQLTLFETFARYLEEYSALEKDPRQYKHEVHFFENYLKKYFDDVLLKNVRRGDVQDFISWLKRFKHSKGLLKPGTINRKISVLQSFFSWCIRQDIYEKMNPCSLTKVREHNVRHIHLTGSEICEIIEKSKCHQDLHTAVMIAIYSGMRRSEITSLKWSDVDFERQRINVRADTTKDKQYRSVPIPDVLRHYLEGLEKTSETIVNVRADCITKRFQRLQFTFSFRNRYDSNLRFHDLRHVYAQSLRDAGVSLDDIQSFLGHSSPVITHQRYAQSGGYDGVRKVNVLNDFIRPESPTIN